MGKPKTVHLPRVFSFWLAMLLGMTLLWCRAGAQKIILHGKQHTLLLCRVQQQIDAYSGMKELVFTLVEPRSFQSLTYRQTVSDFRIRAFPEPDERGLATDVRGNRIYRLRWQTPHRPVRVETAFLARVDVTLDTLPLDRIPFPIPEPPEDVLPYLQPTRLVQSDAEAVVQLSRRLTAGAQNANQAVEALLMWIVHHIRYVLNPPAFDALATLKQRSGNCQNFSHLAAALCRAAGIPTRIVNGFTADLPYQVEGDSSSFQFQMARGRHAWIEVYLPGGGWIPLDAQQSKFFVSSRYLRVEVGVDEGEAVNDGLVRWRQSRQAAKDRPSVEEQLEIEPQDDRIQLSAVLEPLPFQKLFLAAPVGAPTQPLSKPEPLAAAPARAESGKLANLQFTRPSVLGNLQFPEGLNFSAMARTRSPGVRNELRKNFLVETAEYVTGPVEFAQAFVLDDPLLLKGIDLALAVFGGQGELWLELSEDVHGRPGKPALHSAPVTVRRNRTPGYHWVHFSFRQQGAVLGPGRYWLVLRFRGVPIVNWFYTYGKSVGPADGTRSRPAGSHSPWHRILAFEFVYRILGKRPSGH